MAQAASKLDPLLKEVDDVRKFLDSEKIPVFLAPLCGHKGASVTWDKGLGGDWKEFIATAKSLGARGVYLSWERFEEAEITEAVATIEIGFVNSSGVDVTVKDVEKFRPYIGMTAVVEVAFIVDGVAHWYEHAADWFREFEELMEEDGEPSDENDSEKSVDKAVVRKWAGELAKDPRFRTCKNYDQREYLLEQIAGDDLGSLPIYEILSRAETIYNLEIRPVLDEQLAYEARALRKKGMTLTGIAQKLGLSRDKVSGMLSE